MQYVTYLRVSTQRQGHSGLGIEAQRHATATYAQSGQVICEYVEIESGKNADRPQLAAALQHCKVTGSTLLVAKLDRLARNVEFTARLMNSDVDFIAADNPHANKLTIHIMAAMAENEREQISLRTKQALAAAKARGIKLGGYREKSTVCDEQRTRSAQIRAVKAQAFAENLRPILADIGPGTLAHIAQELTQRRVKTPAGGRWTPTAVRRVIQRLT